MEQNTYCNPIPLPDLPRGIDEALLGLRDSDRDYCSVSDPDGYYINGVWYIFTSYGGAYSSRDLMHWESHTLEGIDEIYYGPAVLELGGKFYFTACKIGVYVADSPFGPYKKAGDFRLPDGSAPTVIDDPDFFADDDGRIYLFWGCGADGIMGAELDRNDPAQMISKPQSLIRFDSSHKWERWGEYNQDTDVGWTEGVCMIKRGGRYYLNYAACGTTFSRYATGTYYSDTSPLGGFVYQKNNPVIAKSVGLVRGGGHSCIIADDSGAMWAFYTCINGYSHRFERVIGMDKVTVEDGELYCETSDFPRGTDGAARVDLQPLTFLSLASASGCAPGRDAVYAADESMLSFWQPAAEDGEPWLEISFRGEYRAGAYRIIRRDLGLDFDAGIVPEPLCYRVYLQTPDGGWQLAADMWDNAEVKMIDYHQTTPIAATSARLVLKKTDCTKNTAIVSFTVFGSKNGSAE